MRCLILALLAAVPAQAQLLDPATRYEVGQRLRMFERALDKHKGDKEAVARAVPPVAAATPAFFAGQLGKVAGILDRARLALAQEKPDEAKLWAASFRLLPARRVGDPRKGTAGFRIERFYKTKLPAPAKALYVVALKIPGKEKSVSDGFDGTGLPRKGAVEWADFPEGDHRLCLRIRAGRAALLETEQAFSLVADFDARLKKLAKSALLGKKTLEGATLAHHLGILKSLAKGEALETDYPAHRLLVESEAIAAGKWDRKKPGQYWLALPGVDGSPVRIAVPKEAARGKRLPVVVALHGAGGSENMFFDGYGDGLVAKLALERGWFVVAPRAGFFSGPDVPALLDALAKAYPIDVEKACLMGHSMGAAQAIALAGRKPGRYAAVAALGGGGSFRSGADLKTLPFFVGVGKLDFAAKNAAALAKALEKAGATVTFKTFPHLEHLSVVQIALPEVFAFFDKALKAR